MAGCNEACHCYVEGDEDQGLVTDGLGSPESPYVITTADGFHIPRAGTEAERLLLSLTDDEQGACFYEVDTGLAYLWDDTVYGWRLATVTAIEAITGSHSLNNPVGTPEDVTTLTLAAGAWALYAKGYIEAQVDIGIAWTCRLYDATAASVEDSTVGSAGYGTAGSTYFVPWALCGLVLLAAEGDVSVQVSRSSTSGTSQLARQVRLLATAVPGLR